MNPYTYTRRAPSAQNSQPEQKGFLYSLATAKISSIMAFAIVLLAAGSAAAITPSAVAEMNQGQEYVMAVSHSTKPGRVLGESITAPKRRSSKKHGTPHAVGTLVNDNGTMFLMLQNGKLGIPDISTFKSWDYSFNDATNANDADHNLPVLGIIVPRAPDVVNTQASSSTSTLANVGWKVLISIPREAVPVGAPVRVAAASDPRQNVTFTFNWGDGNSETSTSTGPYYMSSHNYSVAGQYTFTATAVNSSGNTQSKTGTIVVGTSTVTSLPPVTKNDQEHHDSGNLSTPPPRSTASSTSGQIPSLNVILSMPHDGAVGDQISVGAGTDPAARGITYYFGWGDGATTHTPVGAFSAIHSYTAAGTYTVTVNVLYNDTVLGTTSKTINITQTGQPEPSIDQ